MGLFSNLGEGERRRFFLLIIAMSVCAALIGGGVVAAFMPGYISSRLEPRVVSDARGIDGSPLSLNPGAAGKSTMYWPVVDVAEKLGPAVVGITTKGAMYDWWTNQRYVVEKESGSGVIFDERGYIVTNYHVVEGAVERRDKLVVVTADGRELEGRVVGSDKATDLAVVKVEPQGVKLPVAVFGDSSKLKVGELAVAIGNPVGREFMRTVTVGVISGLNRKVRYGDREFELIQTDATINPGNSGGPLANAQGEVIGINTLKLTMQNVENMGFAIPINAVKGIVSDLMAHGRVIRPWLGVLVTEKDAAAYNFNVVIERGLFVIKAYYGQPAYMGGVRPGDVLLAIDGAPLDTLADLQKILQNKKVGQQVTLSVLRGGKQRDITVVLGEMPATPPAEE